MFRALFSIAAREVCEYYAPRLLAKHIPDRDEQDLYLSRYYLLGGPRTQNSEGSPPAVPYLRLLNAFLHKFHRGDNDDALHSHPSKWGIALILSGGYVEERRVSELPGKPLRTKVFLPLSINFLTNRDFHRVDLLEEDCWTLFIVGPDCGEDWGFWDRVTGEFLYWEDFIRRRKKDKAA